MDVLRLRIPTKWKCLWKFDPFRMLFPSNLGEVHHLRHHTHILISTHGMWNLKTTYISTFRCTWIGFRMSVMVEFFDRDCRMISGISCSSPWLPEDIFQDLNSQVSIESRVATVDDVQFFGALSGLCCCVPGGLILDWLWPSVGFKMMRVFQRCLHWQNKIYP